MESYLWTCPFCDRGATITDSNHQEDYSRLSLDNAQGLRELRGVFVVCPNPQCRQFTLTVNLFEVPKGGSGWALGQLLSSWRLIPPSQAKVYPVYIPMPIRADYQEACLIRDTSPRASATLSRRCLQGMIRDFWKAKGNTLKEEIETIRDKIEPLTWDAIDSVRNVGNIGAHMEKDINLIIDVEPEEAGLLIWLIEHLVKDWYINRHEREERLRALKAVGDAKTTAKVPPATTPQTNASPR
jgi:hypothetical protein